MIYRSPYPDLEIPNVSLHDCLLGHAGQHASKAALIDGTTGRTVTYGQLATAVQQTAEGLASRGFRKGDVFAIFSPNLPEYAIAFLGVSTAGGVNTTINPLYTAEELHRQLVDSQAKLIVSVPAFLDKVLEAVKDTAVEEIFVFGEAPSKPGWADL